jgi:signal peptide peptidase SppA
MRDELITARQVVGGLVMEGGSQILAIDEARILHAAQRASREEAADANAVRAPTSVAVIPLFGALYPRGFGWGTNMEGFRARLDQAVNNPDVGAIVLDVDSPGGTVAGTPETANAVRLANQSKPVTAVVDSLAASAAYWIASQAGQVVVTPSGDVGSIGVLAVHTDLSAMLEQDGVKVTILRSTPYKAEGNPFEPLTEAAQESVMGEISRAHGDFVRAVAAGRKKSQAYVEENFGKGRTVSAARAVSAGMADRVGTMADVLGAIRTKSNFRRRSAMAFL